MERDMKSGSNTIVMQGLFVAGERDGLVLGTMKNVRIRASVEERWPRLSAHQTAFDKWSPAGEVAPLVCTPNSVR